MNFENLNMRNRNTNSGNESMTPNSGRTTLVGDVVLNAPEERLHNSPLLTFNGTNGNFSLSAEQLSRGMMLIGSTGMGKTTIFQKAIDQLIPKMTTNDVMFIFDSKADFLERYYQNSSKCVVISVKSEHENICKSWNIFGELFDENGTLKFADIYAKEISKALFKNLESGTQPFFHIASADLFASILGCFCRNAEASGDFSKLNNKTLIDFIVSASVQDIYQLLNKYPQYRYIQSYLGNPGNMNNQALGILGYLYGMVSSIFVGPFRNSTPAGQFSMRRLMREKQGKIVFLEYDTSLGGTLAPIYSLLFDLAVKESLSLGRGNTYIIADEANLLPYCTTFQDLVNFGRSRGCKTMIGLQSINQLYNNYGEEEAKAIMAGFVNAICLGAVDSDTRTFISERFGQTFEIVTFGGTNLQRNGYTVQESDIHQLQIGEAFVDLQGCKPFKFKFKNT